MKQIVLFKLVAITLGLLISSCCLSGQDIKVRSIQYENEDAARDFYKAKVDKEKIHLLSIAIDSFRDFESLYSTKNLIGLKSAWENVFPISYKRGYFNFLEGNVKRNDIVNSIRELDSATDQNSLVIVVIASHGTNTTSDYYLISSDTESFDVPSTAISGKFLRDSFEKMADKGARILVFIDTCHAEALYGGGEYQGKVYYFASSAINETSKEIETESPFSKKLCEVLNSKVKDLAGINDGFIMLSGIRSQLEASIKNITKKYQQTFRAYPSEDMLEESAILKSAQVKKAPISASPFLPWSVSERNGVAFDYAMIVLEGVSLASFVTCGIVQEVCKCKISKNDKAGYSSEVYRNRGKNAAIGCCVSAGVLCASYIARTAHVYCQYKLKYKEDQYATISVYPNASPSFTGVQFALNF